MGKLGKRCLHRNLRGDVRIDILWVAVDEDYVHSILLRGRRHRLSLIGNQGLLHKVVLLHKRNSSSHTPSLDSPPACRFPHQFSFASFREIRRILQSLQLFGLGLSVLLLENDLQFGLLVSRFFSHAFQGWIGSVGHVMTIASQLVELERKMVAVDLANHPLVTLWLRLHHLLLLRVLHLQHHFLVLLQTHLVSAL